MFKYDPTYSNSLKKNPLLGSKFGTAFDTYIILFVKSKIKLYPLGTEKRVGVCFYCINYCIYFIGTLTQRNFNATKGVARGAAKKMFAGCDIRLIQGTVDSLAVPYVPCVPWDPMGMFDSISHCAGIAELVMTWPLQSCFDATLAPRH